MSASKARLDAHAFLASLRLNDPVILTRDGERHEGMYVSRTLYRTGAWEYATVTVTYGPGRWATEVNAVGIERGSYSLERAS